MKAHQLIKDDNIADEEGKETCLKVFGPSDELEDDLPEDDLIEEEMSEDDLPKQTWPYLRNYSRTRNTINKSSSNTHGPPPRDP